MSILQKIFYFLWSPYHPFYFFCQFFLFPLLCPCTVVKSVAVVVVVIVIVEIHRAL